MCIILRFYDDENYLHHKISVTNKVTYNIQSKHSPIPTSEPASDFLHKVISIYYSHRCCPKIISEIEIVFSSDPKDTTQKHYLGQPKPMLCGKLNRRFHESPSQDFELNWLPDSFKDL